MPARPQGLANSLPSLHTVPGWTDYCHGRLAAAAATLERHAQIDPDDGAVWELLGLVRYELGMPLDTVDAFEKASLLTVIHPLSRLCMAASYASLKSVELARDLYLIQAEQEHNSADMLLSIASGLESLGDPRLALIMARRASKLDPESGQAAYDMCYYSMRCGCPASLAESLAWRAVDLEPDNVHFRIGLATVLVRLEHMDQACDVLRHLGERHFREVCCPCCLHRIAELYRLAGDRSRRRLCLQRISDLTSQASDSSGGNNRSTH